MQIYSSYKMFIPRQHTPYWYHAEHNIASLLLSVLSVRAMPIMYLNECAYCHNFADLVDIFLVL